MSEADFGTFRGAGIAPDRRAPLAEPLGPQLDAPISRFDPWAPAAPEPGSEVVAHNWLTTFEPYSGQHAVCVGVAVSLMAIAVVLAGRWRGTEREARLRHFIAGLAAMSQALMMLYWVEPARLDLAESLPLHLCDIAAILTPIALLFPRLRLLGCLVVFWGVGLSSQAFVQPTLTRGAASLAFWLYWLQHLFIVGAGVYLLAIGLRPGWKDLSKAAGVNAVLFAVIMPLNVRTGWNYMFLGDVPAETVPLFRVLGPWPGRAILIFVLAHAVMAVLVLGLRGFDMVSRRQTGPGR